MKFKNKRMTTNVDLEEYSKKNNIPLNAVITKDLLHTIKQKKGGYIINMDDSTGQGSHWIAVYLDKIGNTKYSFYFDSYGSPPPKEIEAYMLKWSKNLLNNVENSKKIQALKSGYCGQYSLMFISEMQKDNNPFKNFSNYLNLFKINLN